MRTLDILPKIKNREQIERSVMDDAKRFQKWGSDAEELLRQILKKSSKGGFVYAMWVRPFGACKIGFTQKNPAKRRMAVMQGIPYEVGTMACYGTLDAFRLEQMIHDEFDDVRLNGEWFKGEIKDFEPTIKRLRDLVNDEFLARNP